jgi:RNA polymerase sigma-70 factor (ECF subfamily)
VPSFADRGSSVSTAGRRDRFREAPLRCGIASGEPVEAGGNDERAAVSAAQAGDARALESLLRAHHDRIHALCRRLTGNDEDALDATQEAMIAVARGIRRFDGRSAFSTWVYRVATNAALDELRRRRRRPEPAESAVDVAAPGDAAAGVAARVDVDRALTSLPPEQRAAVVLRDLLTLDYAEIAEVLSIPIGTVRSRIARGRGALADLLREDGGNREPPGGRRNDSLDEAGR